MLHHNAKEALLDNWNFLMDCCSSPYTRWIPVKSSLGLGVEQGLLSLLVSVHSIFLCTILACWFEIFFWKMLDPAGPRHLGNPNPLFWWVTKSILAQKATIRIELWESFLSLRQRKNLNYCFVIQLNLVGFFLNAQLGTGQCTVSLVIGFNTRRQLILRR